MKAKFLIIHNLTILVTTFLMFPLVSNSQDFGAGSSATVPQPFSEDWTASHISATTSRPNDISTKIVPKTGYYIADISYSNDGQGTCGWCYNRASVGPYGFTGTVGAHCDGGPCNLKWTVLFKPVYIDPTVIKVSKDREESLSSSIWVQNASGNDVELVYKYEVYANGGYTTQYTSRRIPAFDKIRIMPRYIRNGTQLYEQFFTAQYLK